MPSSGAFVSGAPGSCGGEVGCGGGAAQADGGGDDGGGGGAGATVGSGGEGAGATDAGAEGGGAGEGWAGSAGTLVCSGSTETDARLAVLSSSPGMLVPKFESDTRLYTVSVPFSTTEVSLSAVPCDPLAKLEQAPDNPVDLAVGDTPVAITVTARNNVFKLVYGVTITRREEESWHPLANPTYFSNFVLDAVNPGRIYAGYSNGIYKSVDGGQNWTEVRLFTADIVTAMRIDPVNTDTLYIGVTAVGTGGTGVYRSTNRGNVWAQVVDDASVSSLAIDPVSPSTLYAGTVGNTYAGDTRGVLKSVDGGAHWQETNLGLRSLEILDIQVHPLDPRILYASTRNHLHRSDDSGGSWYVYDTGLPNGAVVLHVAIDPQNPSTLYAATQGDGVFKSQDGGGNWQASNTGIRVLTTNFLLVSPVDSNYVYAATDDGVFRSIDAGAAWSRIPDTGVFWNGDVGVLGVSPLKPSVLYALFSSGSTGAQIYRRTEL